MHRLVKLGDDDALLAFKRALRMNFYFIVQLLHAVVALPALSKTAVEFASVGYLLVRVIRDAFFFLVLLSKGPVALLEVELALFLTGGVAVLSDVVSDLHVVEGQDGFHAHRCVSCRNRVSIFA